MKRFTRVVLLAGLIALLSMAVMPGGASAHPMGNFSINQYSALTLGADKVELRYIVDMAEIPTFQELSNIRADHSTDLTQQERSAFIAGKTEPHRARECPIPAAKSDQSYVIDHS